MSRKRGNDARNAGGDRRIIDPDLTWFVVQAKPSRDAKAAEFLMDAGVDVWVPAEHVTIVRRNRKCEVERRYFASYLFAGVGRDRNGDLRYRPLYDRDFMLGVLGHEKPLPFPAGVLQLLADRLSGIERDETERGKRREAASRLEIGAFHKLLGGPFSSFLAEITAVLDSGRVRADVEVFGRKTPIEVDPDWLGAA